MPNFCPKIRSNCKYNVGHLDVDNIYDGVPTILWLGIKAVNNLTGLELIPAMILLGLLSLTSLYGGLKAVAFTDIIQVTLLILLVFLFSYVGLNAISDAGVVEGFMILLVIS